MKQISTTKIQQADGTYKVLNEDSCSVGPCLVTNLRGELPDICDHLFAGRSEEDGPINYMCDYDGRTPTQVK